MNQEEKKSYFKKHYEEHREERRAKQRLYYQEHRLELIEKSCQYYKEHKPRKRAGDIRRRYGLSPEEYEKMLLTQNGRCGICGELPNGKGNTLHVDHNHETGKIRQLLCHNCNYVIGYAKEDIEILEKSITYLKKHSN